MNNVINKDELLTIQLFSAPIYKINKPEFLKISRKIAKKYIFKRKTEVCLNPSYPVYMTESLNYDPEMFDFANYVAQTAWNLLSEQGYDMEKYNTYFESMWCQEHHNLSLMERHIHGNNVIMTGFYFLDCPKGSSKVVFHDPRDAKVITSLSEKDVGLASIASNMINFEPEAGQLMFSSSWLPHSFTKNESKSPMRFIHFNIAVNPAQQITSTFKAVAEVI